MVDEESRDQRSPMKLVRLDSTPDYIPTLTSSEVGRHTNSQSPQPKAIIEKKQWGRIKNVKQIRYELSERDSSDDDDTNVEENTKKQLTIADFKQAAKFVIQSRKVLKKSRSRSGRVARLLKRNSSFINESDLNMFGDYNIVELHHKLRRQRQIKLAIVQKKFLEQLPTLAEKSVKENLQRRLDVLENIKNSGLLKIKPSNPLDRRPHSDLPPARMRNLRRSIDNTNCPVFPVYEPKSKDDYHGSIDDNQITLSDVEREIAILKSRNKIESELNLPEHRGKRLEALRLNVDQLNIKYQTYLRDKRGDSDRNDMDTLVEDTTYYAPSRFTQRGMALVFFRKYARIVQIVIQWISMIMNKQYDFEKELKSFVDIANEIEDQTISSSMREVGLTFDKKFFKANKEISLSVEARKILTTRWQFRTPQMIKQVMNGLSSLKSLTEYPACTQEKLCKVAWYQTIGPKKVIIRQGHHAESFYFILSGTAFVKKMVEDPVTGETRSQVAARLTKGHSFGEIGLLFDTLRTATVESATPMELLVIGKEDFVRIFMKAENPDDDADHIKFLRNMSFMQNWPIDVLKSEPGACLTHYFKRGSLVTDNDRHSEWIYIVMNGTCEVLKKLRAVKPRNQRELRPKADPMADVILPELGMPNNHAKIDTGKQRAVKRTIHPDVLKDMTNFYESLRKKYQPQQSSSPETVMKVEDAKGELSSDDEQVHNDTQLPDIKVRPSTTAMPRASARHVRFLDRKEKTEGLIENTKPDIKLVPLTVEGLRRPVSRAKFDENLPKMQNAHFMYIWRPVLEKHKHLVPSPQKLKAEYRPLSRSVGGDNKSMVESDVFVQVELLQTKHTFGLNTLNYVMDAYDDVFDIGDHDIPILALVSRGAEIIMLSKKVFLKYADQKCRMLVRDQIKLFPSEEVMQENMQTKADWDEYKDQLLMNYVMKKKKLK